MACYAENVSIWWRHHAPIRRRHVLPSMKKNVFWFKLHWSLSMDPIDNKPLMVHQTDRQQTITWANDDSIYWRIWSSPNHNVSVNIHDMINVLENYELNWNDQFNRTSPQSIFQHHSTDSTVTFSLNMYVSFWVLTTMSLNANIDKNTVVEQNIYSSVN